MPIQTDRLSIDFTNYGQPVTNFFEQPQPTKDWEQYMLSEQHIVDFERDGFVSGIKVMSEEQVDVLNGELVRLHRPNNGQRTK